MVDFTTPSLPGASEIYNSVAKKVDEIEGKVLDSTNLSATASSLTSTLNTDLTDLKAKTLAIIPELPTTPSLNLQAELTALTGLTPGGNQYINKLSSITNSFGSGITASGLSLDTIVSDASSAISSATSALADGTSSVSISSALSAKIPNFELPPGATEAVEKAKSSLLPIADGLKEAASSFSEDDAEDLVTGIFGDAKAREKLASDMAALESRLKPHAEAFDAKIKALEERLKQSNTEARTSNTIAV